MLSMVFRCVRDLRSQDQLVDSKMMVESKAVAFVTLLMVWQRIESLLSRRMKKSRPYTMNNIIELTSLAESGSGSILFRTKPCWRPQAGDKSDVGKHHHLFGHL